MSNQEQSSETEHVEAGVSSSEIPDGRIITSNKAVSN
jgi:hypothetical protein